MIYDKLDWTSKINSLGVIQDMNLPYMNRLLDKVAMDILISEYVDLIEEFSSYNILQVMSIFLKGQY